NARRPARATIRKGGKIEWPSDPRQVRACPLQASCGCAGRRERVEARHARDRGRMRIVERGVDGVGRERRRIVLVQLDQCGDKRQRRCMLGGERVRREYAADSGASTKVNTGNASMNNASATPGRVIAMPTPATGIPSPA